jgi:hypothetical protein
MKPIHITAVAPAPADGLTRTDWFGPEVAPTVVGEYEAKTGGGHVFKRRWTAHGWINSITGLPSTAPLEWRGVVPGSVEIGRYPSPLRIELRDSLPSDEREPRSTPAVALDVPNS